MMVSRPCWSGVRRSWSHSCGKMAWKPAISSARARASSCGLRPRPPAGAAAAGGISQAGILSELSSFTRGSLVVSLGKGHESNTLHCDHCLRGKVREVRTCHLRPVSPDGAARRAGVSDPAKKGAAAGRGPVPAAAGEVVKAAYRADMSISCQVPDQAVEVWNKSGTLSRSGFPSTRRICLPTTPPTPSRDAGARLVGRPFRRRARDGQIEGRGPR